MFETLQTIFSRLYNNIKGRVKNVTPARQTYPGQKDPEKTHSDSTAPEYALVNNFALQVSRQFPPSTAESQRDSDIGSLEEWGELTLKRSIGESEEIEDYRGEIEGAWHPTARGGNREDLLFWSLQVDGIRRVYPYVGSRGVNEINIDDIEGRLDGAYLYVRSVANNGLPTSVEIDLVRDIVYLEATKSIGKMSIVPVILRYYDFRYTIVPSVAGGSSSLGEVQNIIRELTFQILDRTEPYIKYVDEIRRDIVYNGQYLKRVRDVISKPPYRYNLTDLVIEYNGNEILTDELPQGNIPVLGNISFD